MDDADERIGLREIAPQLAAREIEIFGQQARRCAVREHLFEQLARLVAPPAQVQRLDQPEGADIEGGLGQAEIILAVVSQHMLAATQRLFDRGEGRSEEHTSELQSLMRISYAVFSLKKKTNTMKNNVHRNATNTTT